MFKVNSPSSSPIQVLQPTLKPAMQGTCKRVCAGAACPCLGRHGNVQCLSAMFVTAHMPVTGLSYATSARKAKMKKKEEMF